MLSNSFIVSTMTESLCGKLEEIQISDTIKRGKSVEDDGYDSGSNSSEGSKNNIEEQILEPLTIIPVPDPEPIVYIFYNARGLSDYRYKPYGRHQSSFSSKPATSDRPSPLVWILRNPDTKTPSRIDAKVKWANSNELRIYRTQLPEDTHYEDSSYQNKIQLFIQLDPNINELKSFVADVKSESQSSVRKFIGPIVIFLKAELLESQEEKILAMTTMEERTAAYNLVDKKDIFQLTQGIGPHNDSVLSILCAQKQPQNRGQNYAQIYAVLQRLANSESVEVRRSITRVNNNDLSALEIAAIMNNSAVACYIIEVIYNITDNVDAALDLINSRDTQGNSILHLLARKGDTNIETMKSLLNIRLTDGSPLVRMLPNLKKQYPIHIAAQSKESQPLTMKALHDNMTNCFDVTDSDGKTALHYACQRSKDINTINCILSYNKDNINAACKDGFTALDYVSVRDNITNVSIGLYDLNTQMKIEMIKLLKNNGGRIASESFQINSELHPDDGERSVVSLSPSASSSNSSESLEPSTDPFLVSLDQPSPADVDSPLTNQSPGPTSVSGSDQPTTSSSDAHSYEEELASQVLTEFPELSGLLEQIIDESN